MNVKKHPPVVGYTGAEVLPHHNVPPPAVLNSQVSPLKWWPEVGLTFSLSVSSILPAASSGLLSLHRCHHYHKIRASFSQLGPARSICYKVSLPSSQVETIWIPETPDWTTDLYILVTKDLTRKIDISYLGDFSNPTNLSQARVQISRMSFFWDYTSQ